MSTNTDATFRARVTEFWSWFPTIAPAITKTLAGDNPREELGWFVDEVRDRIGGLAWEFGPGGSDGEHTFTVTGEGQTARQLLSHYWLEHAVDVPGWIFQCARQPAPQERLKDLSIEVSGAKVDVETLMVATEVNQENECVNIKAWHEAFEGIDEPSRFQILYLLLDEALGEYGTQTKLGDMEFKSDPDARPLVELPGFLEKLWATQGWQELSPLETYSGYQSTPSNDFGRSDTMTGYTCVPRVVLEYMNNGGKLDDNPVEETGAEYAYVSVLESGVEHHDDPLEFRSSIEVALSKRLMESGDGYVVGGATGTQNCYVDVVIFDGENSVATIVEVLTSLNLAGRFEIKPFAN